jgi:hypothetical protein
MGTDESVGLSIPGETARPAVASYHSACKRARMVFIPSPQRVFEMAPLVPGFPLLDVKPHSPGGTR